MRQDAHQADGSTPRETPWQGSFRLSDVGRPGEGLYDLIAGYHVTHLIEIARELGVWEAGAAPRRQSRSSPGGSAPTVPHRRALPDRVSFGRGREGAGGAWARTSTILATPTPASTSRCSARHMVLGEDYRDKSVTPRGTTRSYQDHGEP